MESAINLTPPSTGLSGILFSVRTQYPEGPEYEKNTHHEKGKRYYLIV